MPRLSVTLFVDLVEDRRMSMEVYADNLSRALEPYCDVRQYRPSLLSLPVGGLTQIRLSRFLGYPLKAMRNQNRLNHILDQGYGHLLYGLDPDRTVVTVHDLIPIVRWKGGITGVPRGRKPWLNMISFSALRRAAHLIADSENTRCDLVRFCKCTPDKISVVHLGVDTAFRHYAPAEKSRAHQTLGLPEDGTKRVLIMGSQFYKNQTGALRALLELQRMYGKPIQLLKTGLPDTEWANSVQELGLSQTSRCLGLVPRALLPDVYNVVDCLLFPSLYEGFGWPPLEAMACGTPVVASNAASLPEVVGDAGLICDPQEQGGLEQAMYAVLTDEDLRQSLLERGIARAGRFTWQRTAQKTLEVYKRVA